MAHDRVGAAAAGGADGGRRRRIHEGEPPREIEQEEERRVDEILARVKDVGMEQITAALHADRVLILDFGSQFTQLIARRVRESGVYSEIWPFSASETRIREFAPRAIILSGGPASVTEEVSPRVPAIVFELGIPVLGICYGEQAMVAALGGTVEGGHTREFGRAELQIIDDTSFFDGVFQVGERAPVWMSHGDRVTRLPPGFRAVGISTGAPFAAVADDSRRLYGVQFHPEVVHTPKGAALLANFVRNIAGCAGDWTMAQFRANEVARIRARVGDGQVICGLSGGVDSSAVVARMATMSSRPVKTFSVGFAIDGYYETPFAQQVADLFQTEHHTFVMDYGLIRELPRLNVA